MLGSNIKKQRQSMNWSQEDLSTRVNTTRQTISKWEKGISVPDATMLVDLADIFHCSVPELLGQDHEVHDPYLNILIQRDLRWKKLGKIILYIIVGYVVLRGVSILLFSASKFS